MFTYFYTFSPTFFNFLRYFFSFIPCIFELSILFLFIYSNILLKLFSSLYFLRKKQQPFFHSLILLLCLCESGYYVIRTPTRCNIPIKCSDVDPRRWEASSNKKLKDMEINRTQKWLTIKWSRKEISLLTGAIRSFGRVG